MEKDNEEIYILGERILALENLLVKTERNITHLNVLVSERITARDNEIKKKKTIEENIDELTKTLKELTKPNEQSDNV